mgnify:CR=1 FL=1
MKEKIEPVRVLHITEELSAAGIESFIMNVYRRIDRSKVQFDFLVLRNEHEYYEEEIKKLGGKKFWIHSDRSNTFLRILEESRKIGQFLKEHPYDIVHIHYTTPLRAPYLGQIRKAGASTRIYHAHSAYVPGKNRLKRLVYAYMRKLITLHATDYFACSAAAGRWIFEEDLVSAGKVRIIYNGLEIDRFAFHEDVRKNIREKLDWNGKLVLIHTGRFTEQKNQLFLIDVFHELKKLRANSCLCLIGDGPLRQKAEKKVEELDLQNSVVFPGVQNNVQDYLFAGDCFVMPSLYEGLPVAGVEAQCAGLPCVFSKAITKEAALTEQVKFVSLETPAVEWVKEITSCNNQNRSAAAGIVASRGYDIQEVSDWLERFYVGKSENR